MKISSRFFAFTGALGLKLEVLFKLLALYGLQTSSVVIWHYLKTLS